MAQSEFAPKTTRQSPFQGREESELRAVESSSRIGRDGVETECPISSELVKDQEREEENEAEESEANGDGEEKEKNVAG